MTGQPADQNVEIDTSDSREIRKYDEGDASAPPIFFALKRFAESRSHFQRMTPGGVNLCAEMIRGLGAHDVRRTSVLRGPERSGDTPTSVFAYG